MKETEELQEIVSAYETFEADEASAVQKKFEKKYPDAAEAMKNFGNNQNEFNQKTLDCFNTLFERCQRLENALASEAIARKKAESAVSSLKKEYDSVKLRSSLNSNQLEKIDGALARLSSRTEDYVLHIAPGARLKDRPKGCHQAMVDSLINMPERIESIKKAEGEIRDKRLRDLEKLCMKAISKELSFFNAYEEIRIDFYGADKYAEIIYKNLCRNSIYKIEQGSMSEHSGRYFVHCGETAEVPEKAFLKSGMIFITGRSPLDGLDEEYINDLKFMNDCGMHSYTAMNADAYNVLKKAGFRCIAAATSEELASGKVISAVESGIENAVPAGSEKYSRLVKKLENVGIIFARTADDILGYILNGKSSGDCTLRCISSLEKTASAAVIKNYFGTAAITTSDISQNNEKQYDLVTGFDYINHFDYKDRKSLYQKAKTMIAPGGLLLFSGKNPVTAIKLRAIDGWEKYSAYEAMWTSNQLVTELEENGFQVRFIIPTGTGLYDMLPQKYKELPTMYIVGAVPLM